MWQGWRRVQFETFPLLALKDGGNILTVVCRPRFEPWTCRMHVRGVNASANLPCQENKWNFCGWWNTLSGCNEIIQCCVLPFVFNQTVYVIPSNALHRESPFKGFCFYSCSYLSMVDSSWNVMAHGDTREGKGKLANGVGSQYPSHYLGTWCIQHYYLWCAHLGCQ